MSKYAYLASPYTGSPELMVARFHAVKRASSILLAKRQWIYSPIMHCHQLAQDHSLPTDFQFWLDYNHAMIESAENTIVLGIDGWNLSKGVAEEILFTKSLDKNVELIDGNTCEFVKWL